MRRLPVNQLKLIRMRTRLLLEEACETRRAQLIELTRARVQAVVRPVVLLHSVTMRCRFTSVRSGRSRSILSRG